MDRSRALIITGAALTGLTLVAVAACNPFVVRSAPDRAVTLYPDGATMASQWNGSLASSTGLGGAVTATPAIDKAGGTYVYVSLTAAPPGAVYAWRLREGACGAAGPVVGPADAYGALTVNDQGRASAAATVPQRLAPAARYHVDVGAAPAGAERVVACGELTRPTR